MNETILPLVRSAQDASGSRFHIFSGLILLALSVILLKTINIFGTSKESYPLAGYSSKHAFPALRARLGWFLNGGTFIDDAFVKYPDQIFRLPTLNRYMLVLPPKYLAEVNDAPDSVLSNGHASTDFFIGNWTTIDYAIFDHPTLDAVKKQYISKIGVQVGLAADEAIHAIPRRFSSCQDWTPVSLNATIRPLLVQIATRTTVGSELCRDPEWIDNIVGYAQSVAFASTYLKTLPPFLRPLAYLLPDYHRIHWYKRRLHKLLRPHIKQFLDDDGNEWGARNEVETLLAYYAEVLPSHEMTPDSIAHRLIGSSVGAFQLTTSVVSNCILDLAAAFDKYAPALREEIGEVLGDQQKITNAHLAKMWKLDSFMKESLRFRPISKLSGNRKVLQPFRLSSGTVLPVGAHISFPGGPMSLSDSYIRDARTFDGFRFERMRLDPKQDHSGLQFTSNTAAAMHLGSGRQQCPGRFFGAAMGKIILIKLLQRFDLALKEGQSRPDSLKLMDMDILHPDAEVLVRERVL
ncbi:putative cytochrome P450 [Byssothecium circinans]|uniref:Putative cytochrome P450 n=1 Tax=Byssothecium circinans TaxID=147558 RepID=A0A6A5TB83_9PLEO|nr:putative cytochrome P450 [Byssothecium circinans]